MNKEELCKFICDLFGWKQCTIMVLRQINKYVRECGYTYLEIARALSYYVDVQNRPLDPKYGIGIVQCVMEDSRKYFAEAKKQRDAQVRAAELEKNKRIINRVVHCKTDSVKTLKKHRLNIEDL